jgi:hypothetical protein
MSNKRYIAVGDHIEDAEGNLRHVEPLEVCRQHQVDPHEAILVERRHHTYRIILRKHPDLPVLRPLQE